VSKGALGLLAAFWPEDTARYAHVPLKRATAGCLHEPAASAPDAPAIVTAGATVTFAEMSEQVTAAAAVLRQRVPEGGRVAVAVDDLVDLLVGMLGCMDADRLAWPAGGQPAAAQLEAFRPDVVIAPDTGNAREGVQVLSPDALREGRTGDGQDSAPAGRPKLSSPVLALPNPAGGEVLHNHKTLLATGVAIHSFFRLEQGASLVLLDPPMSWPMSWLPLAALLGAWHAAATVHFDAGDGEPSDRRVDYLVADWDTACDRYLGETPTITNVHAKVGAIVGVTGPFRAATRRRLARRLRSPVFTVYGRNDLGPVLASHPEWFIEAAAGVPLPNVDIRPLNPADGRELVIGWDAVEDAEMGVRSSLAPAGGELAGRWLRARVISHVDPTGLYYLRRVAQVERTVTDR
jgi:acyl-coenzyme A synthetase/AMP-(fatty) acid ligase